MLINNGTPWDETQAGTNAGATATKTAITGRCFFVTRLSGHTDTNSIVQVLAGAAGATVVWEGYVDVTAYGPGFDFDVQVNGTPDVAVAGKISTSTSDCQVNISGFSIP